MGLNISFFGSSLVSAYWNGAATYYRGIIKALYGKGHHTTFYEPDIYDRQKHRDLDDPEWADIVVYKPQESEVYRMLEGADDSDVIIKASGVGMFDELLEKEVLNVRKPGQSVIYWDVDAPATLDRINYNSDDPFLKLIPEYDFVLTYGGGDPVADGYRKAGAKECYPIYNALDPETHHPVEPEEEFNCDLAFLGNRLPDREKRVEDFFLYTASIMPDKKFILGGNGWGDKWMSQNVKYINHVFTRDHNAFNSSPLAVLNISRDSMARYGFSPATRVFEAAGAGACIITDYWEGIEYFLEPGKEILVANSGDEIASILRELTKERSKEIGAAALKKVLSAHTYNHRAADVERLLRGEKSTISIR
jgi:spore maturation protein CgeB